MRYLLIFSIIAVSFAFRKQSVGIKGRLMCGDIPAANVKVKLFEEDTGRGPDPDDFMASTFTNAEGDFTIVGSSEELTPIDPEVRIYHDCNDNGKACQRKWKIEIPEKYIHDGENPKELMNLGTINLEIELENEVTDCNH